MSGAGPKENQGRPRGSALDTALWALEAGLWPVLITPHDAGGAGAGKRPIGKAWGANRPTEQGLREAFERNPGAGVGLMVGAQGGLVDIDVDDPQHAVETLERMFPDGPADTLGSKNAEGRFHLFFRYDERLAAFRKSIIKGKVKANGEISGNEHYLGLEVRIGSAPGESKQIQTVIPPSKMAGGKARKWIGSEILPLPESVFRDLEAYAAPEPEAPSRSEARRPAVDISEVELVERRVIPYLRKCEPAVSGSSGHDTAFKAACKIGPGFNLPEGVAFDLLWTEWNPTCQPPWSEKDLRRKVSEAYRVEARRGWLLDSGKPDRPDRLVKPPRKGRETAPDPSPVEGGDEAPRTIRVFSNQITDEYTTKEGKAAQKVIACHVSQIDKTLHWIMPGWPKSVDGELFVRTAEDKPEYLTSPARLFAHIDAVAHVEWGRGVGHVSQERFYEHTRMTAERFDAIELTPHEPNVPGIYYMHRDLPEPTGALDAYVDFFSPNTPADRSLIKAMVMTPMWGSPPGKRPGWLVTGPTKDDQQGRGLGKTTLVDVNADEIYCGKIDVMPSDDISDIKTRMLSKEAILNRIARLDNVKTHRFSWGELEGLITATEISGRALYKGEGRRPNHLTWYVTLNGASLSADMAQRLIPIQLTRKPRQARWEEDVREFARKHRWEILADIAALLRTDARPITPRTRWSLWEREVLSKLDHAEECQRLILERQEVADEDSSQRDGFRERIIEKLEALGFEHEQACVFVPSELARKWLVEAEQRPYSTPQSSAHINGLSIKEFHLSRKPNMRGFIWAGDSADLDRIVKLDRETGSVAPPR